MITHKQYAIEFASWIDQNCTYLGFSRYYYDDTQEELDIDELHDRWIHEIRIDILKDKTLIK